MEVEVEEGVTGTSEISTRRENEGGGRKENKVQSVEVKGSRGWRSGLLVVVTR